MLTPRVTIAPRRPTCITATSVLVARPILAAATCGYNPFGTYPWQVGWPTSAMAHLRLLPPLRASRTCLGRPGAPSGAS